MERFANDSPNSNKAIALMNKEQSIVQNNTNGDNIVKDITLTISFPL